MLCLLMVSVGVGPSRGTVITQVRIHKWYEIIGKLNNLKSEKVETSYFSLSTVAADGLARRKINDRYVKG